MLAPSYSPPLIVAALFIASLASYTTLDLVRRIASLHHQSKRRYWLAGGALSMGLGIWSMHFVGMLSFSLPIPLGYDFGITAVSLCIAVLVSYFALSLASRENLSAARLCGSGVLMGLGIAAMHYTGMEAMKMSPAIHYRIELVLLSLLIAIAASTAALWLASSMRLAHIGWLGRRIGAALVMGAAITGMHYTGMAAADFPQDAICQAANGLSLTWLAVTVASATFSTLSITLVLSILDGRLERRTSAFADSLKRVNEKLQYQATHDALTGLPNRVLLFDRIQHAIYSSARSKQRFALYFIDLDGFTLVNDTLGRSKGDAILNLLGARLKQAVRREDLVARLDGDEFVVITSGIPDVAMAAHIAEKLFSCFAEDVLVTHPGVRVSPSIGIALYPDDGASLDDLLSHAEAAARAVKAAGRNNYRFFEAEMNAATTRAIEIQRALPGAFSQQQLFLQYQPKFDCASGAVLGAEALLRWRHPQLGLISPAEFIPIAERAGYIVSLGEWVIEEVCRQLQAWQTAGLETVKIAVNLSQIQLRMPGLAGQIRAVAQSHRIAPHQLMFEITETVAMQNAEETKRTIDELQEAGFEMAIDDFGTGYSSLSYLQQFGVQQMKVDRSFINNLTDTAKGRAIVAAIIQLAHSLNMEVVAEGVETDAQLLMLRELKCDQTQGFLQARPMNGDAFVALLNKDAAGLKVA